MHTNLMPARQVDRIAGHWWGLVVALVMTLTAPAMVRAQILQPVAAASAAITGSAAPADDRSVAAVQLSERGLICSTKPRDSLMRHAQEGYAAAAEFSKLTRQNGRFAAILEGPPEPLLEEARAKGCAVIVADSDQAGLIVAALIGSRTAHRTLPPKPVQEAMSSLLGVLGLESYEQLLLLEAMPAGGRKDDLQPLFEAGVVKPEQLAALSTRIVQSGYAASVDAQTLRRFLADQKEGAGTGKTARQVQQARQAAEATAEKERVEAEEAKKRDAERAATWEKVKTWASGIGVVIAIALVCWVVAGTSSQCPSCQKWFAQQRVQSHEVGRSTGYETETKVDKYKDNKGDVIMTKERQEQVLVTYVQLQHLNHCKFCSHDWWTQSTSKYKG